MEDSDERHGVKGPGGTRLRVGIVGGSGYTGALLAELLLARDDVELRGSSVTGTVARPR